MDAERDLFDRRGVRVCGIADALDVVGERWSLLVVRELFFGVHRFDEIRQHIGAPKDTLAGRLKKLEACGVIERRVYSERPPRSDYWLTPRGAELGPVLQALRVWGHANAPALMVAADR